MKFIITIDDAEEKTLELLLKENIDTPVVVGIPAGLIGKNLEGRKIASYDLLSEILKYLDVEIASHGYYHALPKISALNIKKFLYKFVKFPDKFDYINKDKIFFIGW